MSLKSLCVYILCIKYAVKCKNQPEVRIEQGSVKGLYTRTVNDRQIASFEGIPYAEPPVQELRFKPPVAPGIWDGTLNATKAPPRCLQFDFDGNPPGIKGSEDCLYLNVYTPELPSHSGKQKLLDVIAFIHGGAFLFGHSKTHGPSILLDRDMVLVTFNYRLGPLGFLSTEDEVVPGNNGLKDQVLALKWIQKNIAAFGGNPKSVTLAGLSAGSASCHFQILSPLSKGLFKGAICMSGVALNPWALAENMNEKAKFVANELGCPTDDSNLMISCLRNRPAEHIVELTVNLVFWNIYPAMPYGPVIEPAVPDALISEHPISIITNKKAADVPIIMSFAANEGLITGAGIIINSDQFNQLMNNWEKVLPHLLEYDYTVSFETRAESSRKIKEYYKIEDSIKGRTNLVKLFGDRLYVKGISKAAKISATVYSSPIYLYKFSYKGQFSLIDYLTQESLGVCHADDIFYTVGHFRPNKNNMINTVEDLQMSKQMLDVWVSFAANGTLGENWLPVNQQLPKIVYTDVKGPNAFQLSIVDELGEERFWKSLGLNEYIDLSN